MTYSIKRLFWTILLVVGLPLLYLSTQTLDWGLALLGKVPMIIWGFWTYELLNPRRDDDAGTS